MQGRRLSGNDKRSENLADAGLFLVQRNYLNHSAGQNSADSPDASQDKGLGAVEIMDIARPIPDIEHRTYYIWPIIQDEALAGEWKGYRSSRLNLLYRVIYRVDGDRILVQVEHITPHDYRRK